MSLTISANFIAGTYSGHAESGSAYPPSPGRLLSALVAAAAHSDDQKRAWKVVEEISGAESPQIIAPPAYSTGTSKSFMSGPMSVPAGTKAERKVLSPQHMFGERGGKVEKNVSGHFTITDKLYFVWPSLELSSESEETLRRLCSEVPYLGREMDLVLLKISKAPLVSLQRELAASHTIFAPTPGGGTKLRSASRSYLDWLVERYNSKFSDAGREPIGVDHRVRLESYAPAVPVADGGLNLICIPFARPTKLESALRVVRSVKSGTDTGAFVLARAGNPHLDGSAVGMGVLTRDGVEFDPEFNFDLLGEDRGTASLQPRYWMRSAHYWMTAVPFIAHPDKWVASQQVLARMPEAEILEISSSPIRPSQQRLGVDDQHRAWHISLKTPEKIAGPLLLDTETGSGVLMPDYRLEGKLDVRE